MRRLRVNGSRLRGLASDAGFVAGMGAVCYGFLMIHEPTGWIVGGLEVALAAYLLGGDVRREVGE